jgi:hypothetical protein
MPLPGRASIVLYGLEYVYLTGNERPVWPMKVSAAVALWTCIHVLPVSNLGRLSATLIDVCRGFPQSVKTRHGVFLLNHLQIIDY